MDFAHFMRLLDSEIDISKISLDNVGNVPVSVLYDFCDAFRIVWHSFLFNVLAVLCVPMLHRKAIMNMCSRITAYSSGIGAGSFLFDVLCGVKTGCPLNSVLFILCISPFVNVCNWLSDNPWFFITRFCADGFGSTLDQLCRIEIQASIFKLAQSVAGLHLKHYKYFLHFDF